MYFGIVGNVNENGVDAFFTERVIKEKLLTRYITVTGST